MSNNDAVGVGQVVPLEPGIQVWAGGSVNAANLPQPEPQQAPGHVTFPQARHGAGLDTIEDLHAQQAAILASKTGASQEDVPADENKSWKSGLTQEDMEAKLKASKDEDFLNSVLNNPKETPRLQRVAKKRLASLG